MPISADDLAGGPLTGILVIEVASSPGPAFASVLAADLGATVVVLEPSDGGSALRRLGGEVVGPLWWKVLGRNKQSFALDSAAPNWAETVAKLARQSHILVRDDSAEALAVADIVARTEGVLDLCIHPTGADRPDLWPWSTRPEFAAAASGMMALTGRVDGDALQPEAPLADYMCGLLALSAAVAELRAARLGHRSPRPLRFALHDALFRMNEWQLAVATGIGKPILRNGNRFPMDTAIGNIFVAKDGKQLTFSAATPSVAERLLTLIGGTELSRDPRFATVAARRDNMDVVDARIQQWVGERDAEEALRLAQQADVVIGPICHANETAAHPQVQARNLVQIVDGVPMPARLPRIGGEGPPIRPAPEVGADNAAISRTLDTPGVDRPATSGTQPPSTPSLPFAGLRVVELCNVIAGPFCCGMLMEFGADVIKIERPITGDPGRQLGPEIGGTKVWWGVGVRGKRCVALDLKDKADREALLELVRGADVLVENNRPGALDKIGLGVEALRAVNPRLVMLSVSGFGHTGPFALRPGFGKIAEGLSGIVPLTGVPEEAPMHVGFSLADTSSSLLGLLGLCAQLRRRDCAGGGGAHVDVALFECMLRVTELQFAMSAYLGRAVTRQGTNDPYGWGAPNPERRFVNIRAADGAEILVLIDAKSPGAVEGLTGHSGDAVQSLRAWAAAKTERDVARALKSAGLEASRIQDGWSLSREAYFRELGYVEHARTADGLEVSVPGHVLRQLGKLNVPPMRDPVVGADQEKVFGRPVPAQA